MKELTAETASQLCATAKQKKGRQEINKALGEDRLALYTAMRSESPKLRKNAYRLCGALGVSADIPALCDALERETTLFAIPSLLLALGIFDTTGDILTRYTPPKAQSTEQEKHVREIHEALAKARNRFDVAPLKSWDKLSQPAPVLCVPPAGFAAELAAELTELGYSPRTEGEQLLVETDDIAGLYRAKGLVEALLPLAKNIPLVPEAIADAVGNCQGEGAYRISLLGYDKEKSPLILGIAQAIGGRNNPSHYDCELRVAVRGETCDLYLKPCNVTDTRYPWRKHTIAASMQPALAACLCRWARGFEDVENPRVLDPFCGSGALLFARETLSSCRCLIGVDKQSAAVLKARENAAAGGSRATFVTKDSLRFSPGEGFDLIVSNLPFGNRVGSHSENEALYRNFVRRLPALLAPGGIALLYTMEYRLLARCLAAEPGLRPVAQKRTEAGGLLPRVIIVRKNS